MLQHDGHGVVVHRIRPIDFKERGGWRWRCLLTTQGLHQIGDELAQLTGGDGHVSVERLALVHGHGAFKHHVEEGQLLEGHGVGQDERHPIAPGHGHAGGHLAADDVLFHFVGVEVVAAVAHHGLHFVGGLELALAVDGEVGGRFAGAQPVGHGCGR